MADTKIKVVEKVEKTVAVAATLSGDMKRDIALVEILNDKGKLIKTAQRVWLYTERSGTYTAELKDSKGNIVGSCDVPLVVPQGGCGDIEMRLQVYPAVEAK